MPIKLFVAIQLLALAYPFCRDVTPVAPATPHPPDWPTHFQGRRLQPLPLSATEQRFAQAFPGAIARFTDGEREVILREVTTSTRQLHPAADCFRGLGYAITAVSVTVDTEQKHWRCFQATRTGSVKDICERIEDRHGHAWTDTSSWYWDALLERTPGPWLAITVAQTR